MIYDPADIHMALREDLTLMYFRESADGSENGWYPLHEIRKATNHPDDYTRPSW